MNAIMKFLKPLAKLRQKVVKMNAKPLPAWFNGNLMLAMNADFSHANMQNAELAYINLQNAKFVGTDLTGSTFSHVDLRGADLRDANLKQVSFWEVITDETTILPDGNAIGNMDGEEAWEVFQKFGVV